MAFSCLTALSPSPAFAVDAQIQNLLGRFSPNESLVLSYQGLRRAFLYDQALAVIAFSQAGERQAAQKILDALGRLQSADGSWAFQYLEDGSHMEPAEKKTSPSGAIAWVAMAIEAYGQKFDGTSYQPMLLRTLAYLDSQRVRVDWAGKVSHPVRFSPEKGSVVAFEHNLDSYSAFANSGVPKYVEAARDLRAFLESMWDGRRFHPGFNLDTHQANRDERYLDTQSWGILALGTKGAQGQDFARGLQTNCDEFMSKGVLQSKSVDGFIAYHPRAYRLPNPSPVWSEGSFGMLLSMRVAGLAACGEESADALLKSLDRLTQSDGGVPYATQGVDPDFSTASSVAGTAWRYFLRIGYNPF